MHVKRISCVLVMLCAAGAWAAPIPVDSTDASTIYLGPIVDNDWGRPLTSGDFDGDGYDEIVVAASDPFGGAFSYVYVVRGGPDMQRRGTIDLSAGGVDQVIIGAQLDDNLGASMASGDVNGDGVDDLLLCASLADYSTLTSAGIAYLIYGGESFFDNETRDLSVAGSWNVRFIGPVSGGDMGGQNLFGGLDAHGAAIGRLNDDQYGDIVLGVHLATGGAAQAGRVYVRYGANFPTGITFSLQNISGYHVRIDGADNGDELGTFVLTGDVTGDGIEELIIPNAAWSKGVFTTEGATHIFRGGSLPSTHSLATTSAPISLRGWRQWDEFGTAAAVGDINSDGITDVIVSAPGADAGAWTNQRGDGFVYGFFGSTAYQTGNHVIDYASATPDVLLIGEFEENLGDEMSAGDFNGDGYTDIAAAERFGGPSINGVVEVLFGRAFTPGSVFTANIDTNLRIVGEPDDRIGFSMGAADVNNDGRDEIVFGTPFNNGAYPNEKGTVYLVDFVHGDIDFDGDVDLVDFAAFQVCFSGPTPPVSADPTCNVFDFDLDGDFDLTDYDALATQLAGPSS